MPISHTAALQHTLTCLPSKSFHFKIQTQLGNMLLQKSMNVPPVRPTLNLAKSGSDFYCDFENMLRNCLQTNDSLEK